MRLDLLRRSLLTAIGTFAWPQLPAGAQTPTPTPKPPPETPQFDAAETRIEASSLQLSWKPAPVVQETAELEIAGEYLGTFQTRTLKDVLPGITLSDLSGCAIYSARVRTIGEGGPSAWSDRIELTTPLPQPQSPFSFLLQVGGLPTVYRQLNFGGQKIGKDAVVSTSLTRVRGTNRQVVVEHTAPASVESVVDAQYVPGDQYGIVAVGRTSSGGLAVLRSPPSVSTAPIAATPSNAASGPKLERLPAGLGPQFSFRRF